MVALPYPMKASIKRKLVAERSNKYFGETKNGMKHGEGRLFDENGNLVYEGGWLNDEKCGIGKLYVD